MTTVGAILEIALAAVVLAAGVIVFVLVIRSFRAAARASSRDALRVVLDPAAIAERAEWEFTTMLRDGELTRSQYRTLIGALAQDSSSISRPAASAETDRRRVS
jgi:hypothetical protein